MSKKACVIGWPVQHSLSPVLHGYWLKQYDIDGQYNALEINPEDYGNILPILESKNYVGANLTLPHKEKIFQHLTHIDEEAKAIGAVNILKLKDGQWHGSNSDAYGFRAHLLKECPDMKKQKALILGAGGAARAITYGLKTLGFKQIILSNRTLEKAQHLANHFSVESSDWNAKENQMQGCDLLVNTTSLGMKGQAPLVLDLSQLPANAIVADIVYNPLQTPLLQAAKNKHFRTLDGLGMLIYQAVPAFEAWFGVRPEVDENVRKILEAKLC